MQAYYTMKALVVVKCRGLYDDNGTKVSMDYC